MINLNTDCFKTILLHCHNDSIKNLSLFSQVDKKMNALAKVHLDEIKDLYEKLFSMKDEILELKPLTFEGMPSLDKLLALSIARDDLKQRIILGYFKKQDPVNEKQKLARLKVENQMVYEYLKDSLITIDGKVVEMNGYDFVINKSSCRKFFAIDAINSKTPPHQRIKLEHAVNLCNQKLKVPTPVITVQEEAPKKAEQKTCSIQ